MNWQGLSLGLTTFLIIGLMHPVVIKSEYYFGVRVWPIFGILGVLFCVISFMISHPYLSAFCAVWGFTWLWGIKELFEQRTHVAKGWFPANPQKRALSSEKTEV